MNLPTANQVNILLRYGSTFGAGAITVAATFGVLDAAHAANAVAAINQIVKGLSDATLGISNLVIALGPAIGLVAGLKGLKSGTPQAQGAALVAAANAAPSPNATEAQVAIAKAVTQTDKLKVEGTITAPPAVAAAVPSNKVVSP